MKILITGGAGYIGTQLALRLIEDDNVSQVKIYDNLSRGNFGLFCGVGRLQQHNKIKLVKGDLLDRKSLAMALYDIEVVIHLAAQEENPDHDDDHWFELVNDQGTRVLMEEISETKNIRKMIFLSSTAVYGSGDIKFNEGSLTKPDSGFGRTKLAAEKHVEESDVTQKYIFRAAEVYGYSPAMRLDAEVNRLIFEANYSRCVHIQGSGRESVSITHIDDLTHVLQHAVLHDRIPPGTYNVVSRNILMRDMIESLREVYPDLEHLYVDQHKTRVSRVVSSTSKLDRFVTTESSVLLADELAEFKEKFTF